MSKIEWNPLRNHFATHFTQMGQLKSFTASTLDKVSKDSRFSCKTGIAAIQLFPQFLEKEISEIAFPLHAR